MLDSAAVLPRFTAPRLAGCALWLRADRGVTRTGGDGSTVSSWTDQGRNKSATQGTDANRPTFQRSPGNRASVRYASDKLLDVSGFAVPTAATYIMVVDRSAAQLNRYMLSGSSNTMGIIDGFADASTLEWFGNTTDRLVITPTRTAGRHIVAVTQQNAGAINCYYDGVLTNTKATAAVNLLALGAIGGAKATLTNGMTGDIYEVIVYHRVLPASALQLLFGRLKRRYNTA